MRLWLGEGGAMGEMYDVRGWGGGELWERCMMYEAGGGGGAMGEMYDV